MKTKKGLKQDYQNTLEQEELKKEYGIARDVVVVEKNNPTVAVLKTTGKGAFFIIQIIATVIILVLAIIGLAALLFPAPREELLLLFTRLLEELATLF